MAAAAKARVAQTNGKSWHRSVDEGQMTDLNPQSDPNETPEDVASLYSWANLHGAKYRDFSASRAQTREKARLRVEQAMEEQHQRAQLSPEPKRGNGDTRHDDARKDDEVNPHPVASQT